MGAPINTEPLVLNIGYKAVKEAINDALKGSDERPTLELILKIVSVNGRITEELLAELKEHPLFTKLGDDDKSVVSSIAESAGPRSPLKYFMIDALDAIRERRFIKKQLPRSIGWTGLTRCVTQMLGTCKSASTQDSQSDTSEVAEETVADDTVPTAFEPQVLGKGGPPPKKRQVRPNGKGAERRARRAADEQGDSEETLPIRGRRRSRNRRR
jgi:hypothetical protein